MEPWRRKNYIELIAELEKFGKESALALQINIVKMRSAATINFSFGSIKAYNSLQSLYNDID